MQESVSPDKRTSKALSSARRTSSYEQRSLWLLSGLSFKPTHGLGLVPGQSDKLLHAAKKVTSRQPQVLRRKRFTQDNLPNPSFGLAWVEKLLATKLLLHACQKRA